MPKVVHVVTTRRFAGVEHYIADVAVETASRGWAVSVVGGNPERMRRALGASARWLPGATAVQSISSLARVGRVDICHAHMTAAEALAVLARPVHHAPIVATRHFAEPRGKTVLGRALSPSIARRLAGQIAVSDYVAARVEAPPTAVIPNAVRSRPLLWSVDAKVVLVLQRLELEKDTLTALRAWEQSGLAAEGWSMRVVGEGTQRASLEEWVARHSTPAVEFAGWSDHPDNELAQAGMLLAPAIAEPGGVAVLEAMSAGVPVVAAASGGHLETIGRVEGAPGFPPGDAVAAAAGMRGLTDDARRRELSRRSRDVAARRLTLSEHVDRLLKEYERAGGDV